MHEGRKEEEREILETITGEKLLKENLKIHAPTLVNRTLISLRLYFERVFFPYLGEILFFTWSQKGSGTNSVFYSANVKKIIYIRD